MNVTIVVGGRWHAFDLARELSLQGHHPRLITNYPRFKVRRWGLPDEQIVSLPASMLLEQAVRRTLGQAGFASWQGRVHRIFAHQAARRLGNPQIIHAWSGFGSPSLQEARRRRIPFVVERGSTHILAQMRLLAEESRLAGVRIQPPHPDVVDYELSEYRESDAICVPSQHVADTFAAEGVPENRVHVNTLGVDLSSFSPAGEKPRDFRVLYVGSKSARKGIHYLRTAFQEAALPGATLRLVGGETDETRALLGPPDPRIVLVPHLPQASLAEEYRLSSVFVIASIEEGLAMVQAQAMACGLPLICTDHTGGEDLLAAAQDNERASEAGPIREYAAGFVVPIRRPDLIADCLRRLAADPRLLQAKSHAALNLRHRKLDWGAYAARNVELYRNLLS